VHQQCLIKFTKQILSRLSRENSNPASQNITNEQCQRILVEYLEKIESAIQETVSINDDCMTLSSTRQVIETKIKQIREQLVKLNQASVISIKLIESLNQMFVEINQLISEIKFKSVIGPNLMDSDDTYTWKINVHLLLNDTSSTMHSDMFQCSQWGYKMGMSINLQTDEQNKTRYLQVCFVIFRGDFDAIVRWPFSYPITFCLVDLAENKNHIIHSIRPDSQTAIFGRPLDNANKPYRIARFCSSEKVSEIGSNYVRDGNMFLRMYIDFTEKGVHPFQLK
jgi:hypothetical protein